MICIYIRSLLKACGEWIWKSLQKSLFILRLKLSAHLQLIAMISVLVVIYKAEGQYNIDDKLVCRQCQNFKSTAYYYQGK